MSVFEANNTCIVHAVAVLYQWKEIRERDGKKVRAQFVSFTHINFAMCVS